MSTSNATECRNPATGDLLGFSELHSLEHLRCVLLRARAAQPAWAKAPLSTRVSAVLRLRDYIVEHADELADTISKDNGKTRVDALATEVMPSAMAASYYAKNAKRFLADRRLSSGIILLSNKSSRIHRVPFGVLGIISPWNYPFAIPFSEVVMGLLAGNAVILKTASQTQMVGRALERCLLSAGIADGVFSYVNLPGQLAGDAFLAGGVDKLFFTGSVAVGKKLMAKAAESLTPVSLELGGNDAMLVCADADLERAAAGAVWAGLQNAGQSCGGVERIYVHGAVYDAFLKNLGARVAKLRVGPDRDFDTDIGAMTTDGQLATVRRHVQDALDKGARILAQSEAPSQPSGLFHPAMVLVDVTHEMLVMKEETFGPVLGVMRVDTMDEAIALANDSQLGLTGSVWSTDRSQADRLASQVRAGVVMINDHLMSHGLPETPWGGFKESGIGRTHGEIGFAEMTQPQCIVHDYLPGVRKNMWWYPHSKEVYRGLRGIIDLLYAQGIGKRVSALAVVSKLLPRAFRIDD